MTTLRSKATSIKQELLTLTKQLAELGADAAESVQRTAPAVEAAVVQAAGNEVAAMNEG